MNPNTLLAYLVSLVKNDSAFSALSGRVFPDAAPVGTVNPCMVYQLLSSDPEFYTDTIGDEELDVQIRFYASTRAQANELRHALRGKLLDLCGVDSGIEFKSSTATGYNDTYERGDSGGDYGALFIWSVSCESAE